TGCEHGGGQARRDFAMQQAVERVKIGHEPWQRDEIELGDLRCPTRCRTYRKVDCAIAQSAKLARSVALRERRAGKHIHLEAPAGALADEPSPDHACPALR